MLEEEIQKLHLTITQTNEVPLTIHRDMVTLEATMNQVYEEMFTTNQTVAPLLKAQEETKRRTAQLKEASTTLDNMLQVSEKKVAQ